MRLVPNQYPENMSKCVIKYLNEKWAERGSPNKMKVQLLAVRNHLLFCANV